MAIEFRTEVTVELFPQVIDRLLDSPDGPAGRFVKGKTEALLQAAIPKVGTEYSGTTGKPGSRPGPIKDSGKVVPTTGASYSVVFNHPIAFMHHKGTAPHSIGESGKRLYNPNDPVRSTAPRSPFAARNAVSHPGTTGNPFLTNAAAEVGLRPSGELRRGPTKQVPIFRSTTIG